MHKPWRGISNLPFHRSHNEATEVLRSQSWEQSEGTEECCIQRTSRGRGLGDEEHAESCIEHR